MNTTDNITSGRKALHTKRIEPCSFVESGAVEHNGVLLRKVSSAIINHKKTFYFKCKYMKTPTRTIGTCIFSGRIVNFPASLDLEILHDHSSTCCYARGKKDFTSTSGLDGLNSGNNEKILISNKTNKNKKKKSRRTYLDYLKIEDTKCGSSYRSKYESKHQYQYQYQYGCGYNKYFSGFVCDNKDDLLRASTEGIDLDDFHIELGGEKIENIQNIEIVNDMENIENTNITNFADNKIYNYIID